MKLELIDGDVPRTLEPKARPLARRIRGLARTGFRVGTPEIRGVGSGGTGFIAVAALLEQHRCARRLRLHFRPQPAAARNAD